MKRKERKEWKEKYGETQRSGKHRKEYVCDFWNVSKQSEKERKLMALTTNDSTNMLTS